MKKDNTITVFYDEVTQRDIYRLNGIDVTDTIEMLKDKWERQILDTRCRLFQLDMTVQQRLQEQIADLEAKLAESKKQCQQCKHLNKKIELNIKNKLMSEIAEKDKTITTLIEDSKTSKELLKKQLAEKEKEIRKKVCDDVIKFMEENGFDCSDWLDLFNLISGRN